MTADFGEGVAQQRKAGKALLHLKDEIPVGGILLEQSSLSMDSFKSMVKEIKRNYNLIKKGISPKSKAFIPEGNPTRNLNTMGKNNPDLDKYASQIPGRAAWADIEEARKVAESFNVVLRESNLPLVTVAQSVKVSASNIRKLPFLEKFKGKHTYEMKIPHLGLERLRTLLGGGAALEGIRRGVSDNNTPKKAI